MERPCIVYAYTNKHNEKVYVGKTHDADQRKYLHEYAANVRNEDTYFYNAIRKWGFDAFTDEVLSQHSSDEEAYAAEKVHIAEMRAAGFVLYNTNDGGEGALNPSAETRAKIGAANRGKKHTEGWKEDMSARNSGEGNPMYGKKHTPEALAKNAASNRVATAGEKNGMYGKRHRDDSIEAMRAAKVGGKASDETKAKMSAKRQGTDNPAAKLDWEKVARIRELHATGEHTLLAISKMFDVSRPMIGDIVKMKRWIPPCLNNPSTAS